MVSIFAYILLLAGFIIGYMLTVTQSADSAINVSVESLSFVLPRPQSVPGFPYFIFITGIFYGFVVGVIFTGYLTWKFILKPNSAKSHRCSGVRSSSSSPARPKKVKVANAVVQGPVTYNPQPGKKQAYDPLAEKHWGAWWY